MDNLPKRIDIPLALMLKNRSKWYQDRLKLPRSKKVSKQSPINNDIIDSELNSVEVPSGYLISKRTYFTPRRIDILLVPIHCKYIHWKYMGRAFFSCN